MCTRPNCPRPIPRPRPRSRRLPIRPRRDQGLDGSRDRDVETEIASLVSYILINPCPLCVQVSSRWCDQVWATRGLVARTSRRRTATCEDTSWWGTYTQVNQPLANKRHLITSGQVHPRLRGSPLSKPGFGFRCQVCESPVTSGTASGPKVSHATSLHTWTCPMQGNARRGKASFPWFWG